MFKMSTIDRNARVRTFAKVVDSLMLIVVSGNLASHAISAAFIMSANILDMRWRQQWRHLLSRQVKF